MCHILYNKCILNLPFHFPIDIGQLNYDDVTIYVVRITY